MVKHGVTDEQLDLIIKDKDTALISINFDDFENYTSTVLSWLVMNKLT